jgi:flagella basal body P-ring formation protein FlgA
MSGLVAAVTACVILGGFHASAAFAGLITEKTLKNAIKAHIEKTMSWPASYVHIEFTDNVSNVCPGGENIICRVQSGRNEDFIGNATFIVRFYENGKFLKKETVKARLEVLMNVVVSSRSLGRNTRIGHDDVKSVKRWFVRPPRNIISDVDYAIGKKLRMSVKPNTEITGNMVKDIPAVKKGRPVKIIAESGLMGITTVGVSEQDGMYGELIKVKNMSSGKTIYVRVVDNSLVKVEF